MCPKVNISHLFPEIIVGFMSEGESHYFLYPLHSLMQKTTFIEESPSSVWMRTGALKYHSQVGSAPAGKHTDVYNREDVKDECVGPVISSGVIFAGA